MAGTNGKATAQAERHARRAKEKADARREKATGAAGWVAGRAGDWSLDEQDLGWMEAQKYLWNPLMDYWFRMEIEGFEKIPEPPALLIGIHSGAPFVWDAWTVGFQWWRHFGADRPLHGTAHDALMAAPLLSAYFRKMGVLLKGRRLARALQLDKLARLKMFPIALQAPWGLSPAMLPELPLPTKIRTAFQDPVRFGVGPERADDDEYVERKYREVHRSIQAGMDALAR